MASFLLKKSVIGNKTKPNCRKFSNFAYFKLESIMEVKKALYILQEIAPYLEETPMSVWSRDLPQGIKERGAEVRAFMPKYGFINERRNQLHEVFRLTGMNIIIDDTDHPLIMKTASLPPSRISVFFIFNDDYFISVGRDKEIKEPPKELETAMFADNNHERSIFFVRSVIEALRKQRWSPDVIQCSGWISALAPLYMRELFPDDPSFRDAKIVYELWDDCLDQPLNDRLGALLVQDGINIQAVSDIMDQPVDYLALSRLAMRYSDAIVQCSDTVQPELLKLAQESGLPLLPYTGEEGRIEAMAQFYESL